MIFVLNDNTINVTEPTMTLTKIILDPNEDKQSEGWEGVFFEECFSFTICASVRVKVFLGAH